MRLLLAFKEAVLRDQLTKLSAVALSFWCAVALLPFCFPSLLQAEIDLPLTRQPPRLQWFEPAGWFGYDSVGASLFLQVLGGAQVSLQVGFCTVVFSLLIGVPLGAVAGNRDGLWDTFISRCMDVLLSFPPLVLPIVITALLGGGFIPLVLALTVGGWIGPAKLVRGEFKSLNTREFVEAARALGASPNRVMFIHMLPHAFPALLVHSSLSLAGAVLAEAGLSFLGLGLGDDRPSWGGLLSEARSYLLESPHLAIFPSMALLSLVLSLHFLAESLRAGLDPKAGKS